MEENELLVIRRQKLQQLIDKKVDPFGGSFEVSGSISEIRDAFAERKQVRVAGRITAHRNMGKGQFLDLSDITDRIQIFVNLKEFSPDDVEIFSCSIWEISWEWKENVLSPRPVNQRSGWLDFKC